MINYSPSLIADGLEINRAILRLMAQRKEPIGQGNLNLLLRKLGFGVSVPTIGRRLQELEFEGLLQKVSVDGRVITPHGREVLERWQSEDRLRRSGEALLETLRRSDRKHILDLLSARRIIERETAALAAQHASVQAILRLEEILESQTQRVNVGDLGISEDVSLHREIARASGNRVLNSLVLLLRSHERYDGVIASMRAVMGTQLVEDHKAILEAIKSRDPEKARTAMDEHLRKLMVDIDRYWRRWLRDHGRKGK
jgi:GntR family transcriptional repressor for pyruvate dehydrogenase complex